MTPPWRTATAVPSGGDTENVQSEFRERTDSREDKDDDDEEEEGEKGRSRSRTDFLASAVLFSSSFAPELTLVHSFRTSTS
jgi:hypothetical protein